MGTPPPRGTDQERAEPAAPGIGPGEGTPGEGGGRAVGSGPGEGDVVEGGPVGNRRLRWFQRLTAIATLVALIAAGIAVFALFTGDIDDEDTASARDVSRLSDRVDALEEQLQSMSAAEDEQTAELNRLSTQLDELDRTVSDVRRTAQEPPEELQSVSNDVDDLDARVDELESGGGGASASGM